MSRKVRCPACATVNLLPVEEGEPVRCPDCGHRFHPGSSASPGKSRRADRDIVPRTDEEGDERPRKKRKKKSQKPVSRRLRIWLGVGGGIGLIGIVILIVLLSRGGNRDKQDPKGDRDNGAVAGGALIDAPLPDILVDVPEKIEHKIAPAEKPQWVPIQAAKPPAPWSIEPDVPARPPLDIAPDLEIPIPLTPAAFVVRPPVFAGLDGPFVIPGPPWKEKAFEKVLDSSKGVYVEKERPQPLTPVIDIRTGKQAGAFTWRANPSMPGTYLSPDARYLVSPDPIIERNLTAREGTLYVWTQDREEPAKLQLEGSIRWMGFIAPTKLAGLSFNPEPHFTVWDVATTKLERSSPMPTERFARPTVPPGDTDKKYPFYPDDIRGAISPTGKYVAFPTLTGVLLVGTREGKELGFLPLVEPMTHLQFRSLTFSPDGTCLYAFLSRPGDHVSVARGPASETWPKKAPTLGKGALSSGYHNALHCWDVASGQMTLDRAFLPAYKPDFPPMRGRIVPGPIPDTFLFGAGNWGSIFRSEDHGFGRLLETVVGTTLDKLDFDPVYVGSKGQMLGLFKVDDKKHVLRSIRFDEKALRDRGGMKLTEIAARPVARTANRAGATVRPPQPPAKWFSPPAVVAFDTPGKVANLRFVPSALSDKDAAVLKTEQPKELIRREELHWQPVETESGTGTGKSRRLYPWVFPPYQKHEWLKRSELPAAALTADGKRIAVIDPAQMDRVDVWEDNGTHVGAVVPHENYCIDWIGWSAGGKLLTLSHGNLTAWEPATGKVSYEVEGTYPGPVAMAPGRGWIAVCGTDAVDLLDSETGICLARCQPKSPGGGFLAVSIAPDGRYLAAARPLVPPPDPKVHDPAKGHPRNWATSQMADIWDLGTGEPKEVPFGVGALRFLQWRSQRLLLAGTGLPGPGTARLDVLDPMRGVVAHITPGKSHDFPKEGESAITASGDGRVWYAIKNPIAAEAGKIPVLWHAPALFGAETKTSILTLPDRKYSELQAEAIRVEVELDDRAGSSKVAQRLAGDLQRGGFKIGPGNLVLRLTYTVHDGSSVLKDSSERQFKVPEVAFHIRLLDEAGAELWSVAKRGVFAWNKSRYFVGSTEDKAFPRDRHGQPETRFFRFPGDARTAIVAEIIEKWADAPQVALPPAGGIVRAGGASRLLPILEQANLP